MSEHATQESACEAVSATTDEHKLFEPFVGEFKATVRMWMGPGDPMVTTGVMTNSLDLGGRYLHQSYQGDDMEGPFPNFQGRGYWGFNTVTRKFEGFWIDSASTFMMSEVGDVDASKKVWDMRGEIVNPETGQPMGKRSVVVLKDNDHHSMEMYFTMPDGSEHKSMEIHYTRA